ncbi:MAG: hypothetical protein WC358_02325 [Ignavibacteria bacterium]|jgi:phage baseplate assembly protein gpV
MPQISTQEDLKISGFDKLRANILNDSMARLNGVYRGIVTKCKTDTSKPLYVRVKIFGLTDTLPNKAQPWARGTGTYAPPAPGTYVDVTFENGDIHFPVWSNPSKAKGDSLVTKGQKQSKQQNQEIYNSQDGTTVSYNKSTGEYVIDHTSGAKFKIDKDGVITHTAGPGGIPLPKFKVITEASFCPFTQLPHQGGSDYFMVSAMPGI